MALTATAVTPAAHLGVLPVIALVVLALIILAVRGSGSKDARIKELREEIERRSELMRSFPEHSESHRLYLEETNAMAEEIRTLKGGSSRLGMWPVIAAGAVFVGLLVTAFATK